MHGKVIDISNDPTNYGTIRMWEPMNTSIQLWFQDENKFIRAKFTGYCLYSKGIGLGILNVCFTFTKNLRIIEQVTMLVGL